MITPETLLSLWNSGHFVLGANGAGAYNVDLQFEDNVSGFNLDLKVPTLLSSWTMTLPTDPGTSGQVLQTDA